MRDFYKTIGMIRNRGLRINNLFQVDNGWQANLTDGEKFYEFGKAADPCDALLVALAKAPENDDASDLA